jgi:hypothetical protein
MIKGMSCLTYSLKEVRIFKITLQAVFARVLYLKHVANNLTNALNIDVITTTIHKTEKALVDSGATENFIDPKVIK